MLKRAVVALLVLSSCATVPAEAKKPPKPPRTTAPPTTTVATTTTTIASTTTTVAQSGWPNASNTGVPAGTALTPYTGACTITVPNTVIDAQTINCDLRILTSGVVVSRSMITGSISTDEASTGYSFTITDSKVDAGTRLGSGVGDVNFTMRRVEVVGGQRSVNCWKVCDVQDSYVHGQFTDTTGRAHEGGIRMGADNLIRHNTILCDAPDVAPDAGCSADLTGYGDFAPVQRVTVDNNLFKATTGGACAYGGSSRGKPYSNDANNIRFTNNVFEHGTSSGNCGWWFAIVDFDSAAPGNVWSNNVWDTGEPVPPVN